MWQWKENWRILTNEEIYAIVKKPTVTETIRLNRLRWFGHVQRMVENIIPKRVLYKGCPESIQPFWISREPVVWQWGNVTAGQRRPYCASVNSHSPVGLVSWQWDAVDWTCVLCDRHIHNDLASRSASSRQCAYPFYSYVQVFVCKASHHPVLSAPYSPDLAPCDFCLFSKLK